MLLSKEEAAKVLKHLSEQEAAGISAEISELGQVDKRQAARVLEEFGYLMKSRDLVARGGIEKAREIVVAAFGQEKGGAMVEKILERTVPHPFAFLMDLDIEQVKLLLKQESAQVIAVIMSHLKPSLGAQIISSLPPESQKKVAARIARLGKISPEVLRRMEVALKEKVRAQGQFITEEIDGKSVLAEILKNMSADSEKIILEKLKSLDQDLSEEIEKKLFTMDILLQLTGRDLEAVLRDHSDTELALIIKGLRDEQRDRILANVSSRRREIIREEGNALGAVLRSEVNKATSEFLDYIRLKQEKGEITIVRQGEDHIVL